MPNVGGPRLPSRRLLVAVSKATLLYAAPIWSCVTTKKTYLDSARAVSRTMALRLIRAFRTISDDAERALSGILPIDLGIKGKYLASEGHTQLEIREWIRGVWQTRWEESHRGRWTYKLIPELTEWADCKHKTVDYHMTQFLTDHGCFRWYLFRFRHVDTAQCLYCTDADCTAPGSSRRGRNSWRWVTSQPERPGCRYDGGQNRLGRDSRDHRHHDEL
ncbi:GD10378 [Drosophila simulans]|uniref:GD10378 n=1 Tax=Drosophila simulans TaxID=7240 RepID=B4QCN0_DROSI|nr:GD10378 [Drosophila simulans]